MEEAHIMQTAAAIAKRYKIPIVSRNTCNMKKWSDLNHQQRKHKAKWDIYREGIPGINVYLFDLYIQMNNANMDNKSNRARKKKKRAGVDGAGGIEREGSRDSRLQQYKPRTKTCI